MAADVFGTRFYASRKPAWHSLGKVFDDPTMTAERAFTDAGMDYEFSLEELTYEYKGVRIPTGKYGIVRAPTTDDPTPYMAGVVQSTYKMLQPMAIARLIDAGIAGAMPVETVGALGKGETIFATLDAGVSDIKGEEIKLYFLVTDTLDGGCAGIR